KAKGTSLASKPRKSADKSKSLPKAGAKAKPRASEAQPMKVPEGEPIEGTIPAGTRSREQATGKPASQLIDQRIRDLGGWRGVALSRMRALILEADSEVTEEWKWMGTPVWSHNGIICTGRSEERRVGKECRWGGG